MLTVPRALAGLIIIAAALASPACAQIPSAQPEATGLARRALAAPGFAWDSVPDAALATYVPSGTDGDRAATLHERNRAALRHALQLLGEQRHTAHVRIFYVPSRDSMERLVGSRATGITEASSQTVILVENDSWSPFTRHEVMHAVSLRLWSEPGIALGAVEEGSNLWRRGGWLREGLAAHAEDRCGAYANRSVAAAWLDAGTLIPLPDLFDSFYRQPDLQSYLQAGALVEFVLAEYGRNRFRILWDTLSTEQALDATPQELQTAWQAWLRADPRERPDLAGLTQRGCG